MIACHRNYHVAHKCPLRRKLDNNGDKNQEIQIDGEWPNVSRTIDAVAGSYGRTSQRADARTSRYANPPDLIDISARSGSSHNIPMVESCAHPNIFIVATGGHFFSLPRT